MTRTSTTVLIRGAGFQNKGAEAIACTVRDELKKRLGSCKFCIALLGHEKELALSLGFDEVMTIREKAGKWQKCEQLVRSLFATPSLALDVIHNARAIADLSNMPEGLTAVIDISGYAYGDPWGDRCARFSYACTEYCRQRNVRYVFLPQAWGPFSNKSLAMYCRKMCPGAWKYARDPQSARYLADLLGEDPASIPCVPDVAFRFAGDALDTSHEVFAFLERSANIPIVAISPNMRVYERTRGKWADNDYVKVMAEIARHCLARGTRILLLPHEISISERSTYDDRFLCLLLDRELKEFQSKVFSAVTPLSARTLKALVGRCSLLVGSRYHCIVAALSHRVPSVVIGWSHKYESLMRSVQLDDFILDLANLDGEAAVKKVGAAWDQRAQLKIVLEKRVGAIEKEVDALFDKVAGIILSDKKAINDERQR